VPTARACVRGYTALFLVGCAIILASRSGLAATGVLTLATTTSTENSGLLRHIHPDFEKKTGVRVKVIAKGTGASLRLARDGNADVVLVHSREHEDRFVADGYGVMRREVMYNDFIIIGAEGDPAGIREARTAADAFRRIAEGEHVFISRGDGSGTHIREQRLWRRTGIPLVERTKSEIVRPHGDWYISIGQGMGKTISVATERQAYTLADRGTHYAFALADPPRTDLDILFEGDEDLHNPYGVIAVDPRKHPHVNFEVASKYIEWITSPEVQAMVAGYRMNGKVLFHPSAARVRGE
jgi:tungstate transport system substrate-binding protein